MPDNKDYLAICQAMYTTGGARPDAPKGWTVADSLTTKDGLEITAFRNDTGDIVIGVQGTNWSNFSESNFSSYLAPQLEADGQIMIGEAPAANGEAMGFVERVFKNTKGKIYITGHSLGGEIAEFIAAKAAQKGIHLAGGAVFAAPGVPRRGLPDHWDPSPNIMNYVETGDIVANAVDQGPHIGTVISLGDPLNGLIRRSLSVGGGLNNEEQAIEVAFDSHGLGTYAKDLHVRLPPPPTGPGIIERMETNAEAAYNSVGKYIQDIASNFFDVRGVTSDHVFHSDGSTENRARAERYARDRTAKGIDTTTLEQTSGGAALLQEKLFGTESSRNSAAARDVWRYASGRFAEAASGRCYTFGIGSSRDSDFRTTALPKILNNELVRTINDVPRETLRSLHARDPEAGFNRVCEAELQRDQKTLDRAQDPALRNDLEVRRALYRGQLDLQGRTLENATHALADHDRGDQDRSPWTGMETLIGKNQIPEPAGRAELPAERGATELQLGR